MRLLKLTAFTTLLFSFLLMIGSCEKESEKRKAYLYEKSGLAITGAQSVPASASAATGSLAVSYYTRYKMLTYSIEWNNLSGAPTAIGIYGPAPAGYAAITTSGLAPALFSIPTTGFTATGKTSGILTFDNFLYKEQDLLNYLYYVRISTAMYPAGEIRAQIKFQ